MKKWALMILSLLMMLALAAPAMAQTGEPDAAQNAGTVSAPYTVEFTYDGNQYVMPGDSSVRLSAVLDEIGLTGEAEAVSISDESLFSASNETGEWIVTVHQAFSTTEWMKVTINGVVYEITVTDTTTEPTAVDTRTMRCLRALRPRAATAQIMLIWWMATRPPIGSQQRIMTTPMLPLMTSLAARMTLPSWSSTPTRLSSRRATS